MLKCDFFYSFEINYMVSKMTHEPRQKISCVSGSATVHAITKTWIVINQMSCQNSYDLVYRHCLIRCQRFASWCILLDLHSKFCQYPVGWCFLGQQGLPLRLIHSVSPPHCRTTPFSVVQGLYFCGSLELIQLFVYPMQTIEGLQRGTISSFGRLTLIT